jgi:predicted dehydrogenase
LISSSPYLHLSAVVERNSDKSKDVYPWINVFKSTDELFASADIDLVVITTPNGSHYPLALQAMQQGKNVVVEKPFTITSEEANELARVSKETGLICSVYQNRRWDGDFLTVKKLIKGNQLGRLVEFESHFDRFRNFVKAGWREQNDAPGSGMLYDLGAHLIDQGKRSLYIYINMMWEHENTYTKDVILKHLSLFYSTPFVRNAKDRLCYYQ